MYWLSELHQCTGAYRITPVDVNSRPSSCLTNFLLNGRAVMLEQPKKSGSKFISHMLCSHGGEIYIHTLTNSRSPLEDPPSISEGCGGRITDYRISDFGELMKETRLAPAADASHLEELPIERAKGQLERMTRHWPLIIGDTIIFNMLSHIDPLPSLVVREQLSEEEVLECRKAIYYLVGMEERNEALPLPSPGSRGKGPKRDEQYRQMWNELERLVRAHAANSPAHKQVLECLRECRGAGSSFSDDVGGDQQSGDTTDDKSVSQLLSDFDRYQKMTNREKQDFNEADVKRETDSPPCKTFKLDPGQFKAGAAGGQSLLSVWTNRIAALHSVRCPEFSGREDSKTNNAELYLNLKEKNPDSASNAGTGSNSLPSVLKKS